MTRPLLSCMLLVAAAHAGCVVAADTAPADGRVSALLFEEISALDSQVLDAFNHCGEPDRLQEHATYFPPEIEFYHDTGGVTWARDEMLASTSKYVCGHFTRELVPATLKMYPVKDFGAISQRVHRFCQVDSGKCEGLADFVMVWRRQDLEWKITRVLGYGHRAAAAAQ